MSVLALLLVALNFLVSVNCLSGAKNKSLGITGTTITDNGNANGALRNDTVWNGMHNISIVLDICERVTVSTTDAKKFAALVKRKDANYVFFHIAVNSSDITLRKTEDVFLQHTWIWTYKGDGGAFPYLKYPHDFRKLSLGLLGHRTLIINMTMERTNYSQAGPCILTLGEHDSTSVFTEALKSAIFDYLPEYRRKTNVLCYTLKYDDVLDNHGVILYYVTRLFGIAKWYTGNKCCTIQPTETWKEANLNGCEKENIEYITSWTWVLFCVSVVCFLYSPLPITALCGYYSQRVAVDSDNRQEPLQSSNNENPIGQEKRKWVYLGVDKPVTLFNQLSKPLSLLNLCPLFLVRLQRVVFIILPAVVIGAKIALYFTYWDQGYWVRRRMEANIPVGFLAMPFGFYSSSRNWSHLFGGPFVLYGVYFTIGLILFVLPENLGEMLILACPDQENSGLSLLLLSQTTVDNWAWIKSSGDECYDKLNTTMRANFYMMLNRKFWKYMLSFFKLRFLSLSFPARDCKKCCCISARSICLSLTVLPFYVIVCALELFTSLLYYGFPAVFMTVTFIKAYTTWITQAFDLSSCFFRITINVATTVVIFYNMAAFAVLFISSTHFLIEVADYTYIGLCVYPYHFIGYVVGAGTMAYYFVGNIRHVNDAYSTLLNLTVAACRKVQSRSEQDSFSVPDDVIKISGPNVSQMNAIQVNDIGANPTPNQRSLLEPRWSCVKWQNNKPGIPRDLFDQVVRDHRPIRIEVFWFLFRLSVFSLVVTSVVTLQASFPRGQHGGDVAIIAQLFTLVGINILPRLKQLFTSDLDKKLAEEHLMRCIEETVNTYMAERLAKTENFELHAIA